jgi:hypothetical protein
MAHMKPSKPGTRAFTAKRERNRRTMAMTPGQSRRGRRDASVLRVVITSALIFFSMAKG